jgi:uncharacterized membrane protein YedE/YeeE
LENFTPLSSLLGGALIGLSITLLLLFNGRMAGVSGIMKGLFQSPKNEAIWRFTFLLGLALGVFLVQFFSTEPLLTHQPAPLWLIAIGSFLVGIGTRLSNGCTSGHAICGIANLSKRSIFATLTFMGSGIMTVYIIKHILQLNG